MTALAFRAGLAAAALALAGCQKPPAPAPAASAPPASPGEAASPAGTDLAELGCPDDGPRFPITHLCVGRSINYLDPALSAMPEAPDGCAWEMAETAFPLPDGDGALLYRALSCKGVTTRLEFSAGAHSAVLAYAASALYPDAPKGDIQPVQIWDGHGDPKKAIADLKAAAPKAEQATCEVQPADRNGWPTDALLLAPNAAARAKLPKDEPISACGPYGLDEDAQTFWRIGQGYAWFFRMGQDTMDFDPASLLVFHKAADGSWEPLP